MEIRKYELELQNNPAPAVLMPEGARILTFGVRHGEPCIWALIDPDKPDELRSFLMVDTGHPISFDAEHLVFIGTTRVPGDDFVLHLFEVVR